VLFLGTHENLALPIYFSNTDFENDDEFFVMSLKGVYHRPVYCPWKDEIFEIDSLKYSIL
jgi:hypothetical protein